MIKKIARKIISENLYQKLSDFWYEILARFFALWPIRRNKIFITSYFGKGYGDNGKYIYEALRRMGTDCDVVWQMTHPETDAKDLPSGIRAVRYRSLQSVFEMETAAVSLDNSRKMFGYKRKSQLYIQTWHGGPGVKRVEKDVESALADRYVHMAKKDACMCDLMVSNSTFMTELYRNAFWYEGEILECGSPRGDILCGDSPGIRKKVRDTYEIDASKRIVLYAPTFRQNGGLDMYNLEKGRTLRALAERFGGEWVILTRLHPNISDKADQIKSCGDSDINATAYPDMQELLAASDCLITDYSSSDIDFLLTKRPCFLYTPDLKEYQGDRGYYFKWEDFPFPIAPDNAVLEKNILSFDEAMYQKDIDGFVSATGLTGQGSSSSIVAERIRKHMGIEE